MTTLYDNLIESANASYSAAINGMKFDVTYILDKVAGSSVFALLYNAMNDDNIPAIGTDPSAVDASLFGTGVVGCWARDIDAAVIGKSKVRVTLHYQHSPMNVVQVRAGSSLSQIMTNKDRAGNPITLEYTYPDDYKHDDDLKGKTVTQGGTVTLLKPERVREYLIRETNDPDVVSESYEGRVNGVEFLGGAVGTWLCSSITGTNDNSNQSTPSWVNTYMFQYREDGWNPEAAFSDKNTGDPPPDLVADTGIKTIDEYEIADFFTGLPDLFA